jgi:endogenous inhibitor of DNA gyrase (YacG/DUF329 family)
LLDLGAWAEERYAIAGPTKLSEESGMEETEAVPRPADRTPRNS